MRTLLTALLTGMMIAPLAMAQASDADIDNYTRERMGLLRRQLRAGIKRTQRQLESTIKNGAKLVVSEARKSAVVSKSKTKQKRDERRATAAEKRLERVDRKVATLSTKLGNLGFALRHTEAAIARIGKFPPTARQRAAYDLGLRIADASKIQRAAAGKVAYLRHLRRTSEIEVTDDKGEKKKVWRPVELSEADAAKLGLPAGPIQRVALVRATYSAQADASRTSGVLGRLRRLRTTLEGR